MSVGREGPYDRRINSIGQVDEAVSVFLYKWFPREGIDLHEVGKNLFFEHWPEAELVVEAIGHFPDMAHLAFEIAVAIEVRREP